MRIAKGERKILSPQQAAALQSRQRRYREPRPPRIQVLLRQAYELKERLDTNPGLTRDALAREVGCSPTRLTMILNLLNLAPQIRQRILELPPVVGQGRITERRIRPLARLRDQAAQRMGFELLLRGASTMSPSPCRGNFRGNCSYIKERDNQEMVKST